MSLEFDAEEADSLLAEADDIEFVVESQPCTSPELLGAVTETPTSEAVNSTAGMAPREGSDGEMRRGEGLCQGSSFGISAVTETPTSEAVNSTAGMAPRKGIDREMRRGEGLCQGSSLGISDMYVYM